MLGVLKNPFFSNEQTTRMGEGVERQKRCTSSFTVRVCITATHVETTMSGNKEKRTRKVERSRRRKSDKAAQRLAHKRTKRKEKKKNTSGTHTKSVQRPCEFVTHCDIHFYDRARGTSPVTALFFFSFIILTCPIRSAFGGKTKEKTCLASTYTEGKPNHYNDNHNYHSLLRHLKKKKNSTAIQNS